MARATAGSVSIQSIPDGVGGQSVDLSVDITKGNALYDFVECVWTADDGTIVDTTSARVISFWARSATPPTAPTNVTTWNFAGNATWTRGGAQPSPTATLNVYKAIRIEHFDGTAPSAATFVSASWGDGVTKVADAVPVVTTRQRHIYRLSGAPSDFDLASANDAPHGLTTDGTYFYVVDATDDRVYVYTIAGARQQSREFNLASANSTAQGITTDGTYSYVVDLTGNNANRVYVYTVAGARQSTREFGLHDDNRVPRGITTDDTYLYVADSDAHIYVYTLAGARQTTREFDLHNDNSSPRGITTDGTYLYVVDNADDKVYAYTLAGARQSDRDFNLTGDNDVPDSITTDGTYFYVADNTDDKIFAYNPNNASEVPTAPSGGTTTAAYIPSGWQAGPQPDPTSTQAVYRATRTETFTNGVFTSATVYGSVTKVADKVAPTTLSVSWTGDLRHGIAGGIRVFGTVSGSPARFTAGITGAQIPTAWMDEGATGYLRDFEINQNGVVSVRLRGNDDLPPTESDASGPNMKTSVLDDLVITLTVGNATLTIGFNSGTQDDTVDPYSFTPSNSTEVSTFRSNLSTTSPQEATITITGPATVS